MDAVSRMECIGAPSKQGRQQGVLKQVTPTDPTDLATRYDCANVSQSGPRQGSGAVLVGAERGHTWIAESHPKLHA